MVSITIPILSASRFGLVKTDQFQDTWRWDQQEDPMKKRMDTQKDKGLQRRKIQRIELLK